MKAIVQWVLELFARFFGAGKTPVELPAPTPTPKPPVFEPLPKEEVLTEGEPDQPVEKVDSDTLVPEREEMHPPGAEDVPEFDSVVKELQKLLNLNGAQLVADGYFGGKTKEAIQELRYSYGLEPGDVVDAELWEILDRPWFTQDHGFDSLDLRPKMLVSSTSSVAKAWNAYGNLLLELSSILDMSPAAAAAVLAVESAGQGFINDRMVIRFENHIFWDRWGDQNPTSFQAHFSYDPNRRWMGHRWRPDDGRWRTLHTTSAGQDEEWAVYEFASSLDKEAATDSISMGAPQIMGFNAERIGFSSAVEMFERFIVGDFVHILALFDFIRSDHKMVRYLRQEEWVGFASLYNGKGKAGDYGSRIGDKTTEARGYGIP